MFRRDSMNVPPCLSRYVYARHWGRRVRRLRVDVNESGAARQHAGEMRG